METFTFVVGTLLAPALLTGLGAFVLRLLPLISDRVNARAVRLIEAKNKRS